MFPSVSRSLLFVGVLGLGLFPAACRTLPPDQVTDGLTIDSAAFSQKAIVDVVVLPIEDVSPRRTFSDYEAVLRESVAKKLVDLDYSAIRDRTFVDREMASAGIIEGSPVDAAVLGRLRNQMHEDALLGIRINAWELGRLDENPPLVRFSAQVLMIDSADGKTLISGQLDGLINPSEGVPPTTRQARAEAAAQRLGAILLESLPARAPITDIDG